MGSQAKSWAGPKAVPTAKHPALSIVERRPLSWVLNAPERASKRITTLFDIRKILPSPFRRASVRDFVVGFVRFVAGVYQVLFALYLPTSRYVGLVTPLRYQWFMFLVLAILLDKGLAYVPKKSAKIWQQVETERLTATGVATSLMAESVQKKAITEVDFLAAAQGLLMAVRFEVQAFAADQTGYYINVSLLVEDRNDRSKLRVVARAAPNRPNRSYLKQELLIWRAMEEQKVVFQANFRQPGKPYRSILAIPLLAEEEGIPKSLGVISLDSGRDGEFDEGAAGNIEQRLAPYTTLFALLLSIRNSLGE